ncbi:MAG: glycosyltransferase [Desulfovibrionales bacterium]|nr:MAG: glycosyltransferase [Desulfovibrionales bacterium]
MSSLVNRQIDRDTPQSSLESGIEAFKKNHFEEALKYLSHATSDAKHKARAYRVLGNCLRTIGRVDEAILAYRNGLRHSYQSTTHQRLLNALNYTLLSQEVIAREHRTWGLKAEQLAKERLVSTPSQSFPREENIPIRVGFVSADLKSHPVASFLLPIFKNYNKNHFHYTCYANDSVSDGVTKRCKGLVDGWKIIKGTTTAQAREQIQKDGIDILIDLSGHTSGNRLDIFALRAAPIQATYLGYPNTTGLSRVDYRLVDPVTDPPSIPKTWHTEKLYRLPGCFLCYEPPSDNLPVFPPPYVRKGHITFGSFNKSAKISAQCLELWVKILQRVPDSSMLLKSITFESASEVNRFRNHCHKLGLEDIQRIDCRRPLQYRKEHLDLYNEMDIALDTFPYNGTTTTFQALFMSTPVLTLRGSSHVARVSSSILHAMGLDELIANDPEQYVDIALALANNKPKIDTYKKTLREKLLNSPLVDGPRFVTHLEEAFAEMFKASNASVAQEMR